MSSDTESTVCDPRLEVAPEPQVPKGPGQIRRVPQLFTALLLRRKYLLWRCALACERLRCEPWRPWGWGGTTRGLRRPARRGVGH